MARINGSNGDDGLHGVTGGNTIHGRNGDDRMVGGDTGGRDLLIDGSFEGAKIGAGAWGNVTTVGGWKTDTAIEVWGKNFGGMTAPAGDKIVELDSKTSFSRLWQDVPTEAGAVYDFAFDFAARAGTKLATNTIEVYWNGALVGTFDPTGAGWHKAALQVTGTGGLDRIEFREQAADNDSYGGLIDNVSLKVTGDGKDDLYGGKGNDEIHGLGGDDLIYGGSVPTSRTPTKEATAADDDRIIAGDGNDRAYGNNGNDTIDGGNGNDRLSGGRGDDLIYGGTGRDDLTGDSGNDTLSDGSGDDTVNGGTGDDVIVAGAGDDVYRGGTGSDLLTFRDATTGVKVDLSKHVATGMGRDSIHGIEQIEGSSHDDRLKGSKHDEVLSGGDGRDVLRGLGGADVLTGGGDSDVFLWKLPEVKEQYERGTVDRITDFGKGDALDLVDVAKAMGWDAFYERLAMKDDGRDTHLFLDLGAGHRELVVLENVTGLSVKDMIAEGMILT